MKKFFSKSTCCNDACKNMTTQFQDLLINNCVSIIISKNRNFAIHLEKCLYRRFILLVIKNEELMKENLYSENVN